MADIVKLGYGTFVDLNKFIQLHSWLRDSGESAHELRLEPNGFLLLNHDQNEKLVKALEERMCPKK